MRYLNARNFLALYMLAGIACRETTPSWPRMGSQKGDRDAGAEGSADASASSSADAGAGRCQGFARNWLTGNDDLPRRVEVQCYVAPVADGQLECLPANDPTVLTKAADYIHSSGFTGEFVIAADDDQPLPSECEALTECCATVSDDWKQLSCFDLVDDPGRRFSRCGADSHAYECSGIQPSDREEDAGAGANSESSGLCCYQICGHTHST